MSPAFSDYRRNVQVAKRQLRNARVTLAKDRECIAAFRRTIDTSREVLRLLDKSAREDGDLPARSQTLRELYRMTSD